MNFYLCEHMCIQIRRDLIWSRNSSLVLESALKDPIMELVMVRLLDLLTPLIVMHMCLDHIKVRG